MPSIFYTQCPVCFSHNFTYIFDVKDYTVSKKHFEILHCKSCNARFTQNIPDINEIGAYYKSEEYISHTNSGKGIINSLYKAVRVRTLKQKAGLVKKYTGLRSGSLLDVGCGTGSFLKTMQQKGWEVLGLEPDADARNIAFKNNGIRAKPSHELFSLLEHDFNAITLWHVLEHVHPLHEYIVQMRNLLAPGGVIFIAVPNFTSKDARVYGKYWAGYDVPRHLYHFSPKAMEMLLKQHGLKIEKMLPMWFDSFYVDMLSSKYISGKVNYISAGLRGAASNINALGNVKECCSVIYVVKK